MKCKVKFPLVSLSPNLLPTIEKDWQGAPPTNKSTLFLNFVPFIF